LPLIKLTLVCYQAEIDLLQEEKRIVMEELEFYQSELEGLAMNKNGLWSVTNCFRWQWQS
jgi:hypothetical protein